MNSNDFDLRDFRDRLRLAKYAEKTASLGPMAFVFDDNLDDWIVTLKDDKMTAGPLAYEAMVHFIEKSGVDVEDRRRIYKERHDNRN